MESHVYSEDEAKRILDEFPQAKIDELLDLARRAKCDFKSIDESPYRPILPAGWECALYDNCIIARYQDGEQDRKPFFVPQIWIEFKFAHTIEAKKTILPRLALGYCSCGKPIPILQKMLWATDMVSQKGLFHLPHRMVGNTVGIALALWVLAHPVHQYSLVFNRHPECL